MRWPAAWGRAVATADRLVHTGVSDDGDVLVEALAPGPGRRFLSVSAHGAGEPALTLIGLGADSVLAYDIADSETLHRLVVLKVTALALLGREDYLAVMGLRPASPMRRRALAEQVLRGLPEPEAAWWRDRKRWLVQGLFHSDRIAAFFKAFVLGTRAMMPGAAHRTMLFGEDPEARRAAFRAHVRRGWLERCLEAVGARVNLFFPEMEWRASEYPQALNRDPLGYLEDLVAHGLGDNPLFGLYVRTEAPALPEGLLPPHLRPTRYDGLRGADSRLRVVPCPAGRPPELGEAPDGLHGAYLSNVVDYFDPAARTALFGALVPRLGPGAPVLVYSNEAYDKVPEAVGLRLDPEASAAAADRDRAGIYARIQVWRAPGTPPEPGRTAGPRLRIVS